MALLTINALSFAVHNKNILTSSSPKKPRLNSRRIGDCKDLLDTKNQSPKKLKKTAPYDAVYFV
jgi:hypothetical protein